MNVNENSSSKQKMEFLVQVLLCCNWLTVYNKGSNHPRELINSGYNKTQLVDKVITADKLKKSKANSEIYLHN